MKRIARVASALWTGFLWLSLGIAVVAAVSDLARGVPLDAVAARTGVMLLVPAVLLFRRYQARRSAYHPLSERIGRE